MVGTGTPGVEEHGKRRDQLGNEDDNDGLPPIKANSDHCTSKGPVAHSETKVEGDKIPPAPGALLRWSGIEILIAPGSCAARVTMFVEGCILSLNGSHECRRGGESRLDIVRLDSGALSECRHFRAISKGRGVGERVGRARAK